LFIVAFMVALTGALLETSILGAKAAQNAAITRYSDVTIADGVADFTRGLATLGPAHATRGPGPRGTSRSAVRSGCAPDAAACPFSYTISATITAASNDGDSLGDGDSIAGDSALNVQAAAIDEQRVSARVTTSVMGPESTTLGTRTRFLTYRVFMTAPYALVSGSRDGATVIGAAAAAQGDSGGAASATGARPAGPATFDDTRIHVRLACATVTAAVVPFVNDQQLAGNDGLPWGNAPRAAYEAPCASPDAPVDDFVDERWTNGDTDASGWTP
jgi:hypothetical protein